MTIFFISIFAKSESIGTNKGHYTEHSLIVKIYIKGLCFPPNKFGNQIVQKIWLLATLSLKPVVILIHNFAYVDLISKD